MSCRERSPSGSRSLPPDCNVLVRVVPADFRVDPEVLLDSPVDPAASPVVPVDLREASLVAVAAKVATIFKVCFILSGEPIQQVKHQH